MVKNWEDINWKNSNLVIYYLQRKIFDASAKEKGLSIKPKTREFQRKLINCDEVKRLGDCWFRKNINVPNTNFTCCLMILLSCIKYLTITRSEPGK